MSRLPFEFMLALRYLRPKRTFVSAITLISIVGVLLGVAVLIIVIAVMSGFDQQLREKILGFNAHLRIEDSDVPLHDYERLMELVAAHPFVRGVAPYVEGQVMIKTQPEVGSPRYIVPLVRGVDPRFEPRISRLLDSLWAGTNDLRGYSLLVGRQLAANLGLRLGDTVAIYAVRQFEKWDSARKQGEEEAPVADDYTVRGIFEVGFHEFDYAYLVTSLANAQDF